MAIELPGPVADLLNFIGIPWININEDKVREFAAHVKQFASDIEGAHGDAAATLQALGTGYQGAAYEALMSMWGGKSSKHVGDLVEGCKVLAAGLDAGAEFIEAQKIACIAELAVMAAEFVADQAASVATLGIAEAALPVIEEATAKLIEFTEQELEQYIIGEIVNAALQPVMGKVEQLVQGLILKEESAAAADAGTGFAVDHAHLAQHAEVMASHAETVAGHAAAFTANVGALDFSS